MNKTIIQNVIVGVLAGAITACGGDSTTAQTKMLADGEACYTAWSSTTAYTAGQTVSYAGKNYTAAYWTQNQVPSANSGPAGSGQPWISGFACGATPTPAPTPTPTPAPTPAPTPTPTPGPTPAPTPTPTPTPSGSCPQYVNGHTYATGDKVTNVGNYYQCTVGGWCSTGGAYEPGIGWAWQNAWTQITISQCGGTTPTPAPTPAPTPTPTDGGCGLCPVPTPTPTPPPPTGILSGSVYSIVNPNSGLGLNVYWSGTADGTNVNVAAIRGDQPQQWQVTANGDGTYRLTNVDRELNVEGGGTASGTNVNIFSNNNSPAQKWQLTNNGDGTYTVINPNSGKVLDVAGSGTADGTNVDIATNTGAPGQKWKFNLLYTPTRKTDPDFGPNVLIFDPMMSSATIQSKVDATFTQQQSNQFGTNRYAILFKPGAYNASVKVGFYTHVAGLGFQPDDVTINGTVQTDAAWLQGNASQNYWRTAENMSVVPTGGTEKWAASKGSPFRRMHVKGNLALDDGGKSAGGFMADTKVDGQVNAGQQPQWITRNGQIGGWNGSNWNMVFVNTLGAPSGTTWPTPPNTVVTQTPIVRDKPFLHVGTFDNTFSVVVPFPENDQQGTTWAKGGSSYGNFTLDQFYIAKAGVDTTATINAALTNHKGVIFTPGIYHLSDTIRVDRVNTVILGLGSPTLVPDNGVVAMSVADVQGVRIAGLIFEAGSVSSPTLLEVGPTGSSADNSPAPTALNDLSFRIGGAAAGKANTALKINSNNVVGDNIWLWRADHGTGIGWTANTAANGLVVNGNDVTIFGLVAEHFQQNQVAWLGNRGKVYFYQSELPTDVPNQSSWMNGTANGYASYKVANTVTAHEAYGLGIDINSAVSSIKLDNAIEIPSAGLNGLMMHNMTTVSVGGMGTITHVLNGQGGTANATTSVVRLKQ